MTVYIALLRGINVGGRTVKMVELKRTLESMGLIGVQTYIQSGNVLFKSDENEEPLCGMIENKLESVFGFSIPVVLRTSAELEKLIAGCPFTDEEIERAEASSGVESLYVALLPKAPAEEKIGCLDVKKSDNDKYRVSGRDIYLLFSTSIRLSKLADNLKKLGVPSTVRNWNTLSKLASLAQEMENSEPIG